jgi:hypothetical protein
VSSDGISISFITDFNCEMPIIEGEDEKEIKVRFRDEIRNQKAELLFDFRQKFKSSLDYSLETLDDEIKLLCVLNEA